MCVYIYTHTHIYCCCCCSLLSRVWLSATPWTAAEQASLSFTLSWSLLKLMPIESVMPSSHFTHCHPILLLPSTFPSIRVFSNESALHIRWPPYWSFSFSTSLSNEYLGLVSFRIYRYKHIYMYLLFMFFSMILQDIEYSARCNAVKLVVYFFHI